MIVDNSNKNDNSSNYKIKNDAAHDLSRNFNKIYCHCHCHFYYYKNRNSNDRDRNKNNNNKMS